MRLEEWVHDNRFVQILGMCNTKNEPLTVNLSDCDIDGISSTITEGQLWAG
jgi:hypothetical protein